MGFDIEWPLTIARPESGQAGVYRTLTLDRPILRISYVLNLADQVRQALHIADACNNC